MIVEYSLTLPDNQQRTRLLNKRVIGTKAGYRQTLTVMCQWATLSEIDDVRREYFPGVTADTIQDVTGVFFIDGDPSIEAVTDTAPDLYLKNATLQGSAWYESDSGNAPDVYVSRGSIQSP